MQGSLIGICAWASFVGSLNELINSPTTSGVALMFYVMLPLFVVAIVLIMQMRRSSIDQASILQLENSIEVELKVRLLLGTPPTLPQAAAAVLA